VGKDVKVRFTAQDDVSATLRGMSGKLQSFAHDVTKIAAGLGLADTFKAIGRAIKASIEEAAAAYPKLGAGLTKVTQGFTEFRVQAGAAFLEILQPAVPLLTSIFDWATKLATQIPNAFDGFRIVLTGISGWFAELPSKAKLMFGELLQSAAGFVSDAGAVASFFGISSGPQLAARLNASSAAMVASAKKTIAAIEAETDRLIAKYGGPHDYGKRAITPAEQAAVDKARAAQEQALLGRNSYNPKPTVIDNRIPIRGGATGITGAVDTANPSGDRVDAMDKFRAGLEGVLGPLGDVHDLSQELNTTLGEMAGIAAGTLTDSFATFFEALGAGQATIGDFAKAMVKGIAQAAISEGRLGMAKGFAKMAEALWPYNPVAMASGAKMVATNAALIAVASAIGSAGGGSGSQAGAGNGGYSGSGSLSSANASQTGQAVATRGTLVVSLPRGAIMQTGDPTLQEFFAQMMKEGAGRNVEFRYT
jgi:hypothetical protein